MKGSASKWLCKGFVLMEWESREMGQQRFIRGCLRVERLETRGNAVYAIKGKPAPELLGRRDCGSWNLDTGFVLCPGRQRSCCFKPDAIKT